MRHMAIYTYGSGQQSERNLAMLYDTMVMQEGSWLCRRGHGYAGRHYELHVSMGMLVWASVMVMQEGSWLCRAAGC